MGAKLSPQILGPQKIERITDSSNPRQWAVWGHLVTGSLNILWREQRGLPRLLVKNPTSSGLKPVNQPCQSPEWREVIRVLQFWEDKELNPEVLGTVSVHFSKERAPCIWGHGDLKRGCPVRTYHLYDSRMEISDQGTGEMTRWVKALTKMSDNLGFILKDHKERVDSQSCPLTSTWVVW